jgi:microcystin-dependent protein
MKRLLLIIAAIVAFAFSSLAQTAADSKGISFQGIARDNTGNVYASKTVNVTFTIQNGTTTVYQETQSGLTTDVAGVFSTYIGSSSAIVSTGNKYSSFATVDFSLQYNIQVAIAINGGSSVVIGTYALQAVPYAKYTTLAGTATNAIHANNADVATNATTAANGVPVGTIISYAGSTLQGYAGVNWDFCDGGTLSRTAYPELFNAIGTMWGSGDGSTTFNVPDLRGMFMRGWSAGMGTDPDRTSRTALYKGGNTGDAVGSYESDDLKSHSHNYNQFNQVSDTWSGGGHASNGDGTGGNVGATSGGTGGNETRPKNVSVMYIIKVK